MSTEGTPRFLLACRGQPVDQTPVWIMRQAGRYLPEYREVRAKTTFLGLCRTPEYAAEVTLQPIRRYGFDAAIIFSDILIPVEPMGVRLEFDEGPKLPEPIRGKADVDRLVVPDPLRAMPFVFDAIRAVKRELGAATPLIGFAGAPFTLAAYLVEGGGSTNYAKAKRFLYEEPKLMRALLEKLADTVAAHLIAQIEAGCEVVQLFDSWAGHLSRTDFLNAALPFSMQVIDQVKRSHPRVPFILFERGVHSAFSELAAAGADVLSVDWTTPLEDARRLTGDRVVLQGNLDPCALFGPIEHLEREVQRIMNEMQGAKGHVFNLGHGVLPETSPAHMAALVDAVRRFGKSRVPRELS